MPWAPPAHPREAPQMVARQDSLAVRPIDRVADFHYRGDSRGLLTAVATSYGLPSSSTTVSRARQVRFDIDQADFATAMRAASAVTKSFTVAMEETVLFASADTAENHRLYDRMGMRSFYIPGRRLQQRFERTGELAANFV